MEKEYDIVIIGAGVTGLAASMYAARLGMRSLVLGKTHGTEMPIGGVITTTDLVENYPGFIRITGEELADKIKEHATSYKEVEIRKEKVEKVEKKMGGFEVKSEKGTYFGKTILFATGTKWKKLEVAGAKELENKGISYCALCDGSLYKSKIVGVIGGSDSAAKDALVLAEHAKKVYIIYRKEKIRAEPINLKRIKNNKKIEVINLTNVVGVIGKNKVEGVILDKAYEGRKELKLDGIFVAIGHEFLSGLAKEIGVKTNEKGEIIINKGTCETNLPGVYAAGDVANSRFKQAITGVAEGCIAAFSAFEFLKDRMKD
jgi:thioredoxin reductase (NADPH)